MTDASSSASQPPPAPEVHAIFCGPIDQVSSQRLVGFLSVAMSSKPITKVHMAFQSSGGFVGDGVFLYNLFRSIPVELTLYNIGQISSAGVIAYLGARNRKTSTGATFMIHQSANSPMGAGSAKLQSIAKSLVLDDERNEAILRAHVNMPDELWNEMRYHNLNLGSAEAVKFGIAHAIGDFAPAPHSQVFNVLN
jgi:ATP-dependent protease ClpP protease subunit